MQQASYQTGYYAYRVHHMAEAHCSLPRTQGPWDGPIGGHWLIFLNFFCFFSLCSLLLRIPFKTRILATSCPFAPPPPKKKKHNFPFYRFSRVFTAKREVKVGPIVAHHGQSRRVLGRSPTGLHSCPIPLPGHLLPFFSPALKIPWAVLGERDETVDYVAQYQRR